MELIALTLFFLALALAIVGVLGLVEVIGAAIKTLMDL